MKKIAALCLMLAVLLTAVSAFADPLVSIRQGDYLVTKEYTWKSWGTSYWGIAIKNTSGESGSFSVQILLYDRQNNIVGVKNEEISTLDDGYESFVYIADSEPFDHVEYTVEFEKAGPFSFLKDAHPYLDLSVTKAGQKAILSVTNNGKETASFVEYYAVFLDKKGEVVSFDWGFVGDASSEIKPGKTAMEESNAYSSYDTVDVYLGGYIY